jgi:hypothetical protein
MVTPFKYTPEIEKLMTEQYLANTPVEQIAEALEVPVRSVISKLSSLGVYKKKVYLTKRGEPPVKKSEYIERIAILLDKDLELLESLEKVNKGILELIATKLEQK